MGDKSRLQDPQFYSSWEGFSSGAHGASACTLHMDDASWNQAKHQGMGHPTQASPCAFHCPPPWPAARTAPPCRIAALCQSPRRSASASTDLCSPPWICVFVGKLTGCGMVLFVLQIEEGEDEWGLPHCLTLRGQRQSIIVAAR